MTRPPDASASSADETGDVWDRLVELRARVRARSDDVVAVRPRVVRELIKDEIDFIGFGLDVPHPDCYAMRRASLEEQVRREGYLIETEGLQDPVFVVAEPTPNELQTFPPAVLDHRLLALEFHARIHAALDQRLDAEGEAAAATVQTALSHLGEDAVCEARLAFASDRRLLPPADDRVLLVETVATGLELASFAPALLESWLPSLDADRLQAAVRSLGGGLAPADLLGAARAEDVVCLQAIAPDAAPEAEGAREDGEDDEEDAAEARSAPAARRARRRHRLVRSAERARRRANLVRAIHLRAQAAALSTRAGERRALRQASEADVEVLAGRLREAIGGGGAAAEPWADLLRPLAARPGFGVWSRRVKLLYDLQKACLDAERPGVSLDPFGAMLSRGARPLRTTLHDQVPVRVHRHLRTALERAARLPATDGARLPLVAALRRAAARAAEQVRRLFAPTISRTLSEVGLAPDSPPEEVALRKVTQELLDRLLARDYLAFGDVRDAISENDLKMQDMASVRRLLLGDALLRADRLLRTRLPGIYRPSTFYLRWLQRLSSLAFGNRVGRALTRYAAIPLLGAVTLLGGVGHLAGAILGLFGLHHVELVSIGSVLGTAAAILGLIESARARAALGRALRAVGRGLKRVFFDLPVAIARLPAVRRALDSYAAAWLRRFVLKPAAVALPGTLLLSRLGVRRGTDAAVSVTLFVLLSVLLNSRLGRELEARARDELSLWWARVRYRFLPNLFRFVMEGFRGVVGAIERLAYTVDELLRFRRGDRRLAFVTKLFGQTVWRVVMYIVQLYVNLLIEPQLNPIKHFPVVTVSHKMMLPFFGDLIRIFKAPLAPFTGPAMANTLAGTTVFLLPGLFGFLVWELSANWKLYEASRPPHLHPTRVGSHGETIVGLLRPGFHAGTVPKVFQRLRRRAARRLRTGGPLGAEREHEALHHVETELRRFAERELLAVLEGARAFSETLRVAAVHLGATHATIDVVPASGEGAALQITLAERPGGLTARLDPGFAGALAVEARHALGDALLGFFLRAEVERVEAVATAPARTLDPLSVPWHAWVARWRADREGGAPAPLLPEGPLLG